MEGGNDNFYLGLLRSYHSVVLDIVSDVVSDPGGVVGVGGRLICGGWKSGAELRRVFLQLDVRHHARHHSRHDCRQEPRSLRQDQHYRSILPGLYHNLHLLHRYLLAQHHLIHFYSFGTKSPTK